MPRPDLVDHTGKRFGKLVGVRYVCSRLSGGQKRPIFLWKCDCGKEKEASSSAVVSGRVRSCGCGLKALHKRRKKWTFEYTKKMVDDFYAKGLTVESFCFLKSLSWRQFYFYAKKYGIRVKRKKEPEA